MFCSMLIVREHSFDSPFIRKIWGEIYYSTQNTADPWALPQSYPINIDNKA